MTTVQIALLRGINVGRAKRVGMPELCRTFVRLGLVDVRSLMVSGNVTFRSPRPLGRNFSATLERAIEHSGANQVDAAADLAPGVIPEVPLEIVDPGREVPKGYHPNAPPGHVEGLDPHRPTPRE